VTAYTINPVTHAGFNLDATAVAPATTNNTVPGGANCALYVKNASGAPINVTFHFVPTINTDGNAVASRVVAVPAGNAMLIPVQDAYEDPATALVTFDVSAITSVTALAVLVGT
jgi:hypothetical protein